MLDSAWLDSTLIPYLATNKSEHESDSRQNLLCWYESEFESSGLKIIDSDYNSESVQQDSLIALLINHVFNPLVPVGSYMTQRPALPLNFNR